MKDTQLFLADDGLSSPFAMSVQTKIVRDASQSCRKIQLPKPTSGTTSGLMSLSRNVQITHPETTRNRANIAA
jgi:hypothetical protein